MPDDTITPADRETVKEFGTFLTRCGAAGYDANTVEPWFDGDMHAVVPLFANRAEFVIVDGQLEVSP